MCLNKNYHSIKVQIVTLFLLLINSKSSTWHKVTLIWFLLYLESFGKSPIHHEYWRLNVCLTVFLNTLLTGIPFSSETLFKTLNSSLSKLMVVLWKPLFWWIDFFWSWWLSNMDIPMDGMVKIQSLRCVCDFIS